MSQQQNPMSRFMTPLLLGLVVFLGFQLFFKPDKGDQKPITDVQKSFEEADSANDKAKIMEFGRLYAAKLEEKEEGRAAEVEAAEQVLASEVRLKVAAATRELAEETGDFNLAVASYNEIHNIYKSNPKEPIKSQAFEEMEKTSAVGKKAASTSIGYRFVDMVVGFLGGEKNPGFSYWFAGVLLAILVRVAVWPLMTKQIMGFKRMALLQPMVKDLQSKYQGPDLQQRTMKLYSKYGINPMAGCLPLLITMPVFLWVFMAMGSYRFNFMQGTFLWINPASAAANPGLFAPNLGEMDVPLVIVYGISMVLQALLTVSDPSTAKQAKLIGIGTGLLFTVLFLTVLPYPSAFLIYWITSNILTTVQSYVVSRMPIPPLVEKSEEEQKKSPLFAGLQPKDGPAAGGSNGNSAAPKTGAPVLHKPKGGKQKKKR
jgi:YidC/Oxa1 family membrane protein insertase